MTPSPAHDALERAEKMPELVNFSSPTPAANGSDPYQDDVSAFEMDDYAQSHPAGAGTGSTAPTGSTHDNIPAAMRGLGIAKHTLGMLLLVLVVFLWTTSNFLGSSIFADDTYAKPFFLTYLNGSTFMLAIIPPMTSGAWNLWRNGLWDGRVAELKRKYRRGGWRAVTRDPGVGTRLEDEDQLAKDLENDDADEGEGLLEPNDTLQPVAEHPQQLRKRTHLALLPTATLAFKFCLLWFCANYFAMACLKYTTVASTTILTSTSSVWTLLIGAVTRTEKFTWRKLAGVLASLAGIMLISKVDMGNASDAETSGGTGGDSDSATPERALSLLVRAVKEFPDKTVRELALGDALALLSAVLYGLYTVMLKQTTVAAAPLELNMPLFFGLVGTWNLVLLLPLFPILHWTGIETFEMPPSARIWWILVLNSVSALASDIAWAYAMVLTSPLVVTVGLSLTIPLSLIGEMLIQGRYEGWLYWLGAGVVVGSFVFVDREEREDEVVEERRLEEQRRSLEAVQGILDRP